ncbi:MAG: hypothetical protein AAFV53_20380 [Myxococcota bacterium]
MSHRLIPLLGVFFVACDESDDGAVTQAQIVELRAELDRLSAELGLSNEALETAETLIETLSADLAVAEAALEDQGSRLAAVERDALTAADLDGYATRVWVQDQGYSTADASDLLRYVVVDPAENTVTFNGANVYIQSGLGATIDTDPPSGLGNLIIGYAEDRDGTALRTGSHNLIVGDGHDWQGYGGVLFGRDNVTTGLFSTVTGGGTTARSTAMPPSPAAIATSLLDSMPLSPAA